MFPASLLKARSPEAEAVSTLFEHVSVLILIVFLTVTGLVVFASVRYRSKGDGKEPRPNFGSQRMEVLWTAVPLLIVSVLFVATVRTMRAVDAPREPNQAPDLIVTGHRWWWEARYPKDVVTANEIHIPVGRRLLVQLESADVIHDFWVPQLARKMDAVPGLSGYIWLEASAAGVYQGACAEFCGAQHAWMRFEVIAEPEQDFAVWLKHQSEPAAISLDSDTQGGFRVFEEKGCGDCHSLSGTDPTDRSGPSLAHVATRRYLGSGSSRNSTQSLTQWIGDPQSAKPGTTMPAAALSGAEAQSLLSFLESLR
jgi:cytochrome c oxidase subunit 2